MRFLLKISIITILLAPTFILAQINYVPLAPIPDYVDPGSVNLTGYLQSMYKFGVALAGILAVLMLVWGGFKYTTSEAIAGKEGGKEIIQNVVWGGAIVLGSFLLLYTINPKLIDVGLAIQDLKPVEKQSRPTAEDNYGKFLDDALQRAKDISTKANDIKNAAGLIKERVTEIERKMREGDFTPEEIANLNNPGGLEDELNTLKPKLEELKTKETLVRSYEGAVDYLSTNIRTQINKCLQGEGACSLPTGWTDRLNPTNWTWIGGLPRVDYTIANKNQSANNAVVNQMLAAAQAKVEDDVKKLNDSGLKAQATDLQNRMQNIRDETTFYITCPKSKTIYRRGMIYESGDCPP